MCFKISFTGKSFMVIKVLLLCHMVLVVISEFSKLSLATAIMALTPVPCYCMTSFNYGGKRARDVDLTCRCHLSNVMPDSIFYDSMRWGTTLLFVFKGDSHSLSQNKRDGFSCLITITPMDLEKP